MKMDLGFIAALVITIVAIVDLSVDLPFIGGYAFGFCSAAFSLRQQKNDGRPMPNRNAQLRKSHDRST
jgi:hypothetical protein